MILDWILGRMFYASVGLPDPGGATETTVDSSDGAPEGESTSGEEPLIEGAPTGEEPSPEKPPTEGQVDWKTVPLEVKSHIQELTKTNPKLGNLLQNAVYTSQSMLREFPGGLKEVRSLKSELEQVGGIEEIKNLQTTHQQFVEQQELLDSQAREGNPQALDTFINIAGNEGFTKLMPTALDKWAASDQPGYSHVMSKIIVNAMREGGVVSELNMAFKLLGLKSETATAEAMESLKRVAEWANQINQSAVKPPERPKVDPNIQTQQRSIDEQKAQLFNQEFAGQFGTWRNRKIVEEVANVSNGRKLNDYQMQTLGNRIVEDIKVILEADPEYMKSLRKIYDTRDMAELNKFTRNRTAKLLPEVTKKAFKSLFSDPGKKPGPKPGFKPNGSAAHTEPAPKGWQRIDASKAPTPDEIDSKLSSFEMKFKQQAILKNGRKVYWGKHVPVD